MPPSTQVRFGKEYDRVSLIDAGALMAVAAAGATIVRSPPGAHRGQTERLRAEP